MSLADVKPKAITLNLDQERHLIFDLNAFAEIEDKYGDFQLALEKFKTGSVKAIRSMLWAGLVHEDEKLTEKQVGALVTLDNIQEISDAITVAITAAIPEEEENQDPNQ